MTALRNAAAAALALLALGSASYAQDSFGIDESDLFGSEDALLETVPEASDAQTGALFRTNAFVMGGSFSGSLGADWTWNDPWSGFSPAEPDAYGLSVGAAASLYFDARPTDTARFHGSVKTAYPFDEARVFELFSDFSFDDALFLRFGKQTVTWGVGYFFSPADVINLKAIDPLHPTEQREGPVTLRVHYPIPGTQHNLWAYAVFDAADMKPEDTALAAKAEFGLGAWELGTGIWFQRDRPLRGVLTAVGSVGQVSLFGEATLSRGSDKSWVSSITGPYPLTDIAMKTDDSSPFFKGTAGFLWTQSDWKLTVAGQYLYDGEGYADADREARISEAHSIIDPLSAGPAKDGAMMILKGLVLGSGRHYAALSVSKTELFTEDLSCSLFAMGNLSDLSGFAKLGLSWQLFKGMSADIGATFAFGAADSEYLVLNDGPSMALSLGLSLGSGSF